MNYYLVGGCPSFHCRSQKTGPINIFRVAFRAPRLFLAQPPFCSHSAQAAAQDPETRGAGAGSRFVGVRLLVGARQCGLTVTAMRWQSLRDSARQSAALTVTAMRWQCGLGGARADCSGIVTAMRWQRGLGGAGSRLVRHQNGVSRSGAQSATSRFETAH